MDLANRRGISLLVLLAIGLATGAAAAPGPVATLLSETPDGFTVRIRIPEPERVRVPLDDGQVFLRISIPGFLPGSAAPVGHPDLPQKGFPFGIPDDAEARIVRARVLETTSFTGERPIPVPRREKIAGDPFPSEMATYEVDPAAYAATTRGAEGLTELGPVMGWRHQRVQTLIVHPVQVNPSRGVYEAVRELEVEIRYTNRTAGSGARRVPVPREPGWDEVIDRAILNPATARTFRRRSAPAALPAQVQPGDVYVRVRFGTSGFARIPYADLVAAGWPAGIPVAQVEVQERGYNQSLSDPFTVTPVAREVQDTNQNGVLDAGDFVFFYGFNYQDRFQPLIADARYCYFHAYWIHPGTQGLDFPGSIVFPTGTDYTEVTSFPSRHRYEDNEIYINNPKDSGVSIFPIYDAMYWLDSADINENLSFPVSDLVPTGNFTINARWQGKDTVVQTRTHIVSLDVNGTNILDSAVFFERFPYPYNGTPQPSAGILLEGNNILTVRARTEDPSIPRSGAYFDWFEVIYDRQLKADNDRLLFNSGTSQGKVEFVVTGFSGPGIEVLDLTDPANIQRLPVQVESAGATYTARVRVEITGAPRTYTAAVAASINGLPISEHPLPPDLESAAITPGLPRDLLTAGVGSDYILITHSAFQDAWQPLVDHRESQGYSVFLCNVWEIYDQFAGGDKTPWAIQRFLTQAYRTWDPSPTWLLLGGDGSEDYRNDTPLSDPDWVPTLMYFGNVPGVSGLELSGTDTWYAAFLREGDPPIDVIPEMYVGRLPVGSVAETQAVVQKILDYESMDPDEAWRNRGFFLADDQYSTSILANAPYCWQASEASFKNTTQAICDSLRIQGRHTDFVCNAYFLGDKLDSVATLNRNPGPNDCPTDTGTGSSMLFQTRSFTKSQLNPPVIEELSRGQLIFEFTGHGNKNLMTHEALLEHRPNFSLSSRDMDKINNLGRPFLFMGYACHLAEFEGAREKADGEAIGDVLLVAPDRGAIGVMASTGYEWLHTNPIAQMRTSRNLFWDIPRDPATGRPRRLFGEAVTRSFVTLVLEEPTRADYLGMVRSYQTFADPALRIDFRVGSFQIQVDGTPWTDGTPLTAASFQDSISVEGSVSDDVDLSSIRVLEAGVEIPAGRLSIIPPDPEQDGAQAYQIAFKSTLKLGTYDLEIEATDWSGRVSTFSLPVALTTVFKAGEILLDPTDNLVDPDATIQIEVTTPVPLDATAYEVRVDGLAVEAQISQASANQWVIQVPGPWGGGPHNVDLLISDPQTECLPGGCPLTRSVAFAVTDPNAGLELLESYIYPNPVESDEALILYNLNRNASRTRVTIYSVSGRRVYRTETSGFAGRNTFHWDLRDEAGDAVANGIYLVVLEVEGLDGTTVTNRSDPERMAVTR